MHEVSIALNLLEIVSAECRKSGSEKIESVNVKIGRASGILPDALLFAFEAVKDGSPAKEAVLNIEEAPVGGICHDCGGAFSVAEEYVLACPLCSGTSFLITSGRELDIIDIEVS